MNIGLGISIVGEQAVFSPSALLAGSTAMVWLDPSDLTTMFQDTAGTTPVTTPGQSVALALDKSKGLVLGPNIATVSSVTGAAIGGPAFTTYDISPVMVAGRTYEISFTVSGYSGSGAVGLSANASSYEPDVPFASSSISGNGTVRVVAISSTSVAPIRIYTQSTNTANFSSISVRELAGNHATQSTAASRPTYGVVPSRGRVNLLTFTEQFDNAAWVKNNSTVTANVAVAPDGTTTADALNWAASTPAQLVPTTSVTVAAGTPLTFTAYGKAGTKSSLMLILFNDGSNYAQVSFNLTNGTAGTPTISGSRFTSVSVSATDVGNGWYRCTLSANTNTLTSIASWLRADTAVGSGDNILVWGAQLETGSTATPYQRVVSQFEVTDPAGFPSYPLHYLSFDGIDDFLITPTITPNIDKVQVFAGLRKLSDAASTMLLEFSPIVGSNAGSFNFNPTVTGGFNTMSYRSRGAATAPNITVSGFSAPVTLTTTMLTDISTDLFSVKVNGTQAAQDTTDQGTGNYLAYPLYIGRRGGTSLPFNGHLYGLIVRFGANLDAGTISGTERWVGQKTGVTIA